MHGELAAFSCMCAGRIGIALNGAVRAFAAMSQVESNSLKSVQSQA
jgi:hypothetical protein